MNTSSLKAVSSTAKRPGKAKPKNRAGAAKPATRKKVLKSSTDVAIATELAPAVAIALLEKTDQAPGAPAPALEILAAGVSASEVDGKVRVQLMFENGAVLPVEMSAEAGAALSQGLTEELPAPD